MEFLPLAWRCRLIVSSSSIRPVIRAVALPREHGGWGFVLEPIVLALGVAPSVAGTCISLAVLTAFLFRQPLRLVIGGTGPFSPANRRGLALVFSLIYAGIAAAGLAVGTAIAGPDPLLALLVASPAIIVFLAYDTRKRSRRLIPEIAGPVGLATVAPAVALAGGWGWGPAWVLWVLMMARAIPSIAYVRAKLRMGDGDDVGWLGVIALHAASICIVAWFVVRDTVPMLTLGALFVLAVRAAWGLKSGNAGVRVTTLGVLELVYGLIYVSLTIAGYRWGA